MFTSHFGEHTSKFLIWIQIYVCMSIYLCGWKPASEGEEGMEAGNSSAKGVANEWESIVKSEMLDIKSS